MDIRFETRIRVPCLTLTSLTTTCQTISIGVTSMVGLTLPTHWINIFHNVCRIEFIMVFVCLIDWLLHSFYMYSIITCTWHPTNIFTIKIVLVNNGGRPLFPPPTKKRLWILLGPWCLIFVEWPNQDYKFQQRRNQLIHSVCVELWNTHGRFLAVPVPVSLVL